MQKGASFGSIVEVKMRGPNTDWLYLQNTWGSAWEINPTPNLPWDFVFKSENGQEVGPRPALLTPAWVLPLMTQVWGGHNQLH